MTLLSLVCGIGLFLYCIVPRPPVTLSFLGYTGTTNGVPIARFSIFNHSGRPARYLSEGPNVPYYYLSRLLFHDTNTGFMAFTNYHPFSIPPIESTIPAGGNVTFTVPMVAGTTNIRVGVHCLPKHPPVRTLVREVRILVTGTYSESWENVELRAPFE